MAVEDCKLLKGRESMLPRFTDINIRKVIQGMRDGYRVGIDYKDGIYLVTNTHVLLQLNGDLAWEIQCAFKLREFGFFYNRERVGVYERGSKFPEKAMELIERAQKAKSVTLTETGLFSNYAKTKCCYLARPNDYTAIDSRNLDMFAINTLEQDESSKETSILVNGKHVVAPIRIYNEGAVSWLKVVS